MRNLAIVSVLGVIALGACQQGEETGNRIPADANPTQVKAFELLEAQTNTTWKWVQHQDFGTPMHLSAARKGARILAKGGDAKLTSLSVLEANKNLFRMRDPQQELDLEKSETDELGMTHARFQQMTHGIPVTGAEVHVHYDTKGHLASIDANYVADLDSLDLSPTVAIADVAAIAKADVTARTGITKNLKTTEPTLAVFAKDKNAKLAWTSRVTALAGKEPAIWVTTIDAKTGEVLNRYNDLQAIAASGKAVMGDQRTFEVTSGGAAFQMTDASAGVEIRTSTAREQEDETGTVVSSSNQNSWDTGVFGAGAAVDAHTNAAIVAKYYKEKHARNALDGKGGALVSVVHFGQRTANAFWTGSSMLYGDGDGTMRPFSVALDVVAHEFTHGVTTSTSNLTYQDQSGALNEAVSDIFGTFVEHVAKPNDTNNWEMGEALGNKEMMRSMKDPTLHDQPAHMTKFVTTQQDNGGVHINSGIINHAAFLMTVGGTNAVSKVTVTEGIGWEKSEKLWYRANTKYFMASTNFGQAAQGVIQAAKDVGLTVAETNRVDCAFKAVGIAQGECASMVEAKTTTPGGGDDDETGDTVGDSDDDDDSADDEDDDKSSSKKKKKTTKRQVIQSTSGCNTSTSTSSSALGGQLFLVGLVLTALKRRKK